MAPDRDGLGTATYSRMVPVGDSTEKALKKRTLTKLYNESPAWLRDLHHVLDTAVLAAYGLPLDASEQSILAHLLALNLERTRKVQLPTLSLN